MSSSDAERWNVRYRSGNECSAAPARVLLENLHLLPTNGRALDLAAGLGGNALLLAQHGLETDAWDISSVAMERLEHCANQQAVKLHTQQRDIVSSPPDTASFDVIVVSRFLDRSLCPFISQALKPGGLLFYQTWTVDSHSGPGNPEYRLQRNELLELFAELQIILYREESIVCNNNEEAMLIALST